MKQLLPVLLLISAPCLAFDPSVLRNDKESETHAYSPKELRAAELRLRNFGGEADFPTRAYTMLTDTLQTLERSRSGCEWSLIRYLTLSLHHFFPAADERVMRDLMIIWRSQDRIDDLFYEILENALAIEKGLKNAKPVPARPRDLALGESLLTESKATADDLTALFAPYRGASIAKPGCTARSWARTSQELGALTGGSPDHLRPVLIAARERKLLSDEAFELLEVYRNTGVHEWDLPLDRYLAVAQNSKNRSRPSPAGPPDLEQNELSSRFQRRSGSTYRRSLYSRFNSRQVNALADTLNRTFERMDATRADVVFQLSSGPEAIPVSPMGQYFLARKLLKKDIDDLRTSMLFQGTAVTYEDLLTAGLETGLVTSSMLDRALKIDDLWNPEVDNWKKLKNFGYQVTGTASLFLPPPFNMISSIGLVLVSGVLAKKSRKNAATEAHYDFF